MRSPSVLITNGIALAALGWSGLASPSLALAQSCVTVSAPRVFRGLAQCGTVAEVRVAITNECGEARRCSITWRTAEGDHTSEGVIEPGETQGGYGGMSGFTDALATYWCYRSEPPSDPIDVECGPACPEGQVYERGVCACAPGHERTSAGCVPACAAGEYRNSAGQCVPTGGGHDRSATEPGQATAGDATRDTRERIEAERRQRDAADRARAMDDARRAEEERERQRAEARRGAEEFARREAEWRDQQRTSREQAGQLAADFAGTVAGYQVPTDDAEYRGDSWHVHISAGLSWDTVPLLSNYDAVTTSTVVRESRGVEAHAFGIGGRLIVYPFYGEILSLGVGGEVAGGYGGDSMAGHGEATFTVSLGYRYFFVLGETSIGARGGRYSSNVSYPGLAVSTHSATGGEMFLRAGGGLRVCGVGRHQGCWLALNLLAFIEQIPTWEPLPSGGSLRVGSDALVLRASLWVNNIIEVGATFAWSYPRTGEAMHPTTAGALDGASCSRSWSGRRSTGTAAPTRVVPRTDRDGCIEGWARCRSRRSPLAPDPRRRSPPNRGFLRRPSPARLCRCGHIPFWQHSLFHS